VPDPDAGDVVGSPPLAKLGIPEGRLADECGAANEAAAANQSVGACGTYYQRTHRPPLPGIVTGGTT
jgi:hypothetical protein